MVENSQCSVIVALTCLTLRHVKLVLLILYVARVSVSY